MLYKTNEAADIAFAAANTPAHTSGGEVIVMVLISIAIIVFVVSRIIKAGKNVNDLVTGKKTMDDLRKEYDYEADKKSREANMSIGIEHAIDMTSNAHGTLFRRN